MRIVGVDENGLGPRLGPLVVTAAVFEQPAYDRAGLWEAAGAFGIGDSKEVGGFGDMARCESIALAALRRVGASTDSFAALLASIAARPVAELRSICPTDAPAAVAACWEPAIDLPAFGGDGVASELPEALGLVELRSEVLCPGAMNTAKALGKTKLAIDLRAMESLLFAARERAGAEVQAICGHVGGIRYYRDAFGRMGELLATTLEESVARSEYRVAGFGRVLFEVDADATHLPVALASIVGKYVRELFVERLNRFYKSHAPRLQAASGYHDPVSAAFVEKTARIRRKLRVPDDCFER